MTMTHYISPFYKFGIIILLLTLITSCRTKNSNDSNHHKNSHSQEQSYRNNKSINNLPNQTKNSSFSYNVIKEYFKKKNYHYPVHFQKSKTKKPPVWDNGNEYYSNKYLTLFCQGNKHIEKNISLTKLQKYNKQAKAFLLESPCIFIDAGTIYYSINMTAFSNENMGDRAIKITQNKNIFWKLTNIALYKSEHGNIIFVGWVL